MYTGSNKASSGRFLGLLGALVLTLLAALSAPSFGALKVDLYEAEVPLRSRSEQDIQVAQRRALSQALTKLTGRRFVPEEGVLAAALRNPGNYISRFGYVADPGDASLERLSVAFEPAGLLALARRAGLPVWDATRPLTLAWVTLRQGDLMEVLGSGSQLEVENSLREVARSRGAPVVLPLMDLQEWKRIPPELVWGLFRTDIRQASERYGADSVLIGRLTETRQGWTGDWELWLPDRRAAFTTRVQPLSGSLVEAGNVAADLLAQDFALGTVSGSRRWVQIDGVNDLQAYARTLGFFEGLLPVSDVAVRRLEENSLLLEIVASLNEAQLLQRARLNPNLDLIEKGGRNGVIRLRFVP